MTIWKYVGCEISYLPDSLGKDDKLSKEQIKLLLAEMPLVSGEIEATTVNAVTALLINDGIMPLKLHPFDKHESALNRLKRLRRSIK